MRVEVLVFEDSESTL